MILLSSGAKIAIIVLSSLVGFYLFLCLIGFIFTCSFKSILKKHTKAITIVLYNKYDLLKKLLNLLNKNKIEIDQKYVDILNNINPQNFKIIEGEEAIKVRNNLCFVRDEIFFVEGNNEILLKHNLFQEWKNNIIETDKNYRNLVIMYNADVLGYNYWINFLPYRLFTKLFKIKSKELL